VAAIRDPGTHHARIAVDALLNFSEYIVQALLSLIVWVVIAYAVLSWLIAFQVVNLRNPLVYRASRFLDSVVTPLLAPFRRILPNFGGMDFSPIILFILIGGIQRFLIPPFFAWLHHLVAGPGLT
jgi:YggT family protein